MTSPEDGSITHVFQRLTAGEQEAMQPLWEAFFPRVVGLARKQLSYHKPRMNDAEDAALSALMSFWQQAEGGNLAENMRRNDIWNLLATMIVRKVIRHRKRETAQKRGGGKVFLESDLMNASSEAERDRTLDGILGKMPAVEFDLACEEYLCLLDEDLPPFALLRLLGNKNKEIAETLSCSESKVERKIALIRQRWMQEFQEDE